VMMSRTNPRIITMTPTMADSMAGIYPTSQPYASYVLAMKGGWAVLWPDPDAVVAGIGGDAVR
jgi:hypothetical protein